MKGSATVHFTDGKTKILDHKPDLGELQRWVGGDIEIVRRTVYNPTFEGQMIVNSDDIAPGLLVNKFGTKIYGHPSYKIVGNVIILTGDWMAD